MTRWKQFWFQEKINPFFKSTFEIFFIRIRPKNIEIKKSLTCFLWVENLQKLFSSSLFRYFLQMKEGGQLSLQLYAVVIVSS